MNRFVLTLLLIVGAFVVLTAASPPLSTSLKAAGSPGTKLSSLVGCWSGKGTGGAVKASYELVSSDTALVEHWQQQGYAPMYTIYYLDGQTPMAHHFCSFGNQVRFKAEPGAAADVLDFKLLDATNVANADVPHMTYVKFSFRDKNHFDQEWGLHQSGKDGPQAFTFKRVVQGCKAATR